jgi:RNA polymerase-binding transcription factor DksA
MKSMTDDTLRAMRAQLLARGAELRDRRQRVQADLRREKDPLAKDSSDAAIQLENDEVLQAIDAAARGEIEAIDAALARLDAGQFGSCERCGSDIEIERLHAIAYATTCGACSKADRWKS